MIPAKITSTTAYSTLGSVRRLSQTQSTMNSRPRNTSTPPTIMRGINAIAAAPNTTAVSGTSEAISPVARASTFMRSARVVRLSAWYPGVPPNTPETTLRRPASRSSVFASRSRSSRISVPLMLNKTPITATNTTVTMPAACPRTAHQSAPVRARKVHGWNSQPERYGPSIQNPFRASSIDDPVTSMPIANSANPTASTIGMTSGFFTSRTARNMITPNARAGSQCVSVSRSVMDPNVPRCTSTPEATYRPPFRRSHPAPAMKPPTTGYGTNRIRLPSLSVPITTKTMPVSSVTTRVAATTVTNARLELPNVPRAVAVATTANTATTASCRLPTTPRVPALHAMIASVIAAATRNSPMPSARNCAR